MKKFLSMVFLAVMVTAASAQNLKIGLLGGINSTWLFNKNVSDAGDELDYASTFGGTIGVSGIYSFSDVAGVSIGFLYSGHNQKYEGEEDNVSRELKLKLSYLDIPIMLRLTSPKGPYFEIGPQISLLMGAKEDFEMSPSNSFTPNYSGKDFKDNFKGSNISIAFGFGVDIDASENLVVSTGLRFGYSLTDVTEEFTEQELIALAATEKLSATSINSHYNDQGKFNYEKTNRAFGGLLIGLYYKLQ